MGLDGRYWLSVLVSSSAACVCDKPIRQPSPPGDTHPSDPRSFLQNVIAGMTELVAVGAITSFYFFLALNAQGASKFCDSKATLKRSPLLKDVAVTVTRENVFTARSLCRVTLLVADQCSGRLTETIA